MKSYGRLFLPIIVLLSFLPVNVVHAGEFGRNLALCVGIDEYEHLAELYGPVNDALTIGLLFEEMGDFRKVITLTKVDASGEEVKPRFMPTKVNIINYLKGTSNNFACLLFFPKESHSGETVTDIS